MAKLTDALVVTLQGYFDSGDQPTEAEFDTLIAAIQAGIEEHNHDATGDGDGIQLDWDNVWADAVHSHANAGEGGTLDWDVVWVDAVHDHSAAGEGGATLGFTAMTGAGLDVPDGWYQGIGAALERIVFHGATDRITMVGAKLGINVEANYRLDVIDQVASYVANFFNDGNNDANHGIRVQCGLDLNPTANLVVLYDGDAGLIGAVKGDGGGGTTYWSASDERLKDILGPIDPELAMEALANIDPICYVGKGGGKQKNLGFSAQDIHRYFPEVATYNEEADLYGMSYERLVPVLWAQNKALLGRIEQLEEK